MNGVAAIGVRRLAAGILAMAALFHVQWLAACDIMPMAGDEMACCAEGQENHQQRHCDEEIGSHDCVTPFANGVSSIKSPERTDGSGDIPQDLFFTAPSFVSTLQAETAKPLHWHGSDRIADGRVLYLVSRRLRL